MTNKESYEHLLSILKDTKNHTIVAHIKRRREAMLSH